MGYYVNPPTESKESFLSREGRPIQRPGQLPANGRAVVCLVDNGVFTAAGVVYNDRELADFSDPDDHRPRQWFEVDIEKLRPVVSDLDRVFPA